MNLEIALRPDERVVKEFTISRRLFWSLIIVGVLLAVVIPLVGTLLIPLLGFVVVAPVVAILIGVGIVMGLALAAYAFYFRAARHYVLTDQRFLETVGFLSRRTISADYEQVTDIRVHQDAFERLILGTGLVAINTAGTDIEEIRLERVTDPYHLSNQIRQLCETRLRAIGRGAGSPAATNQGGVTPPPITSGPAPVASPTPLPPKGGQKTVG